MGKQQLYLPDYTHVAVPGYWDLPAKKRPQSLLGVYAKLAKPHDCIWEIATSDALTGEIVERSLYENVITDNGALNLLQRNWNSLGATLPALANQIAITPNGVAVVLQTALVLSNVYTALSVSALSASLPSGSTVVLGFGTGQTQTVTTSALANAGATSLTVNSFTANANYAVGANVVANPTVLDNPSSLTNAAYSGALATGAFAYANTGPNSGLGNRQVVITFQFLGASQPAGSYTEAWTINANPVVANSTLSHIIFPVLSLNSSTNQTITITERA